MSVQTAKKKKTEPNKPQTTPHPVTSPPITRKERHCTFLFKREGKIEQFPVAKNTPKTPEKANFQETPGTEYTTH